MTDRIKSLRRLLVRLSETLGELPSTIIIPNVTVDASDRWVVGQGGYGEVYRGIYAGGPVALKVYRGITPHGGLKENQVSQPIDEILLHVIRSQTAF